MSKEDIYSAVKADQNKEEIAPDWKILLDIHGGNKDRVPYRFYANGYVTGPLDAPVVTAKGTEYLALHTPVP